MPLATMNLIGRLGNLIFSYAHLRARAERDGYEICLPPWIGERIFKGVPKALRPRHAFKVDLDLGEDYCQRQECLIYTRKQVKEWFAFKPEVLEKLQPAKFRGGCLLNVREASDYIGAGMVCISKKSYAFACMEMFGDSSQFDWELDTDPFRLPEFTGDPSASGLGTTEVCLPSFYRLMTAPILFRANSTFAFWSATLAENQRVFSPVIEGMKGGIPNQHCSNWVEGNWPRMSLVEGFTDLHLRDE